MKLPLIDDGVLRYIDANGIVTANGERFEWREHSYMLEPLCDMHPMQGINKSAQVGWSESMIVKAFFLAKYRRMNILYTLPSDSFLELFVPPKVDQIINKNPLLSSMVTGNTRVKRIENGKDSRYIYFVGAHNPEKGEKKEQATKGISYTVDVRIHDEASRSDQFILSQMESRTANSSYAGAWYFDNPTYPKMGADRIYSKSDKKHWFVKCSKCGHKQYLDWIKLSETVHKVADHCYVDDDKQHFVCGKCARILSDQDRMRGEWVAMHPSVTDYRGYWLSQLCYVRHSARSLLQKEADESRPTSQFYNFVLGKPYVGSDVKVSRSNILANSSSAVNLLVNNYMGIDQGIVKHYVVGNSQGIFQIGKTKDWAEIEQLFNKYRCKAVCDALPYQQDPKALAKKYPGRFYRAFYKPHADQSQLVRYERDMALIRRDEAFDELVNLILSQNYPIQVPVSELEEYISHWEALVRIISPDHQGNERFRWERTTDDHYAHATLYMEMAKRLSSDNYEAGIKPPTVAQPVYGIEQLQPQTDNLYKFFAKLKKR